MARGYSTYGYSARRQNSLYASGAGNEDASGSTGRSRASQYYSMSSSSAARDSRRYGGAGGAAAGDDSDASSDAGGYGGAGGGGAGRSSSARYASGAGGAQGMTDGTDAAASASGSTSAAQQALADAADSAARTHEKAQNLHSTTIARLNDLVEQMRNGTASRSNVDAVQDLCRGLDQLFGRFTNSTQRVVDKVDAATQASAQAQAQAQASGSGGADRAAAASYSLGTSARSSRYRSASGLDDGASGMARSASRASRRTAGY
ncbi:hypothetical protein JCM10212_001598 [Sporobolomyces blumeae]